MLLYSLQEFLSASRINGISLSQTQEGEFEWYLRDHLFRNMSKGVNRFEENSLPQTMIDSYLRYRNANRDEISTLARPVVELLVTKNVVRRDQEFLELAANLSRKRCTKCFYVCYVSENESSSCFRCFDNNLQDFPKKSNSAALK